MVEKSVEFSGGTIIELDLVFEITFCVLPTTSLEKKKFPHLFQLLFQTGSQYLYFKIKP